MLSVVLAIVLVGALALGPVVWRMWRDRLEERALGVRAEVASAVRRALDGESLVAVEVEPPTPLRGGRVVLSVPGGWDWLIRDSWNQVIERVPPDYELVVRSGERPSIPVSQPRSSLPRAA